jgi:F0F1-type ATP synthase membrane subunit b/b'
MVTAPESTNIEAGITELIIDEFKQKVIESLQKEKDYIRDIADREAKLILTRAYEESTKLNAKAQEESRLIISMAKERASREADALLYEAQKKVEQLFSSAEENIRKEASEKTREEVDSILRNAKEEADKQSMMIIQSSQEESDLIITNAKSEAAQVARELTEQAEREAETINSAAKELKEKVTQEMEEFQKRVSEEAESIISTARITAVEKAEKEASEIIAESKSNAQKEREQLISTAISDAKRIAEAEATQILQKARQEAEGMIKSAKIKVSTQIEKSSRLMLEIQEKMQQVIGAAGLNENNQEQGTLSTDLCLDFNPDIIAPIENEFIQPPTSPAPVMEKANQSDKAAPNSIDALILDEDNQNYSGKLKIDITPPADSEQVSALEKHLMKISNIRVVGKGGSEDGSAWIELFTIKPLPLVGILRNAPSVKDVVGCRSYIIVALKPKQTG